MPAAIVAGVQIENGPKFGLHNLRVSLSNWHVNKADDGCGILCYFAVARSATKKRQLQSVRGAHKTKGTVIPHSEGLLPAAGDLGEKEKRKAPPNKSAQAVPSDMPLATSLG